MNTSNNEQNFILSSNILHIQGYGQARTDLMEFGESMIVKEIRVDGYDKWGHINGINDMPRDRFTLHIRYKNASMNWFSQAVDLHCFTGKNKIDFTPTYVNAGDILEITIKHEPITSEAQYQNLVDYNNVQFQVQLIGAKVK